MSIEYTETMTKELNEYLSDLHVLYAKLHNFHWNIVGEGFFTLHAKLEELYEAIAGEIDEIAERILMIGGKPLASLKAYLEHSSLKEVESNDIKSCALVEELIKDFDAMLAKVLDARNIGAKEDDALTVALLENSIGNYQKNLWMLQSYMK